jgi:hypothetical protein
MICSLLGRWIPSIVSVSINSHQLLVSETETIFEMSGTNFTSICPIARKFPSNYTFARCRHMTNESLMYKYQICIKVLCEPFWTSEESNVQYYQQYINKYPSMLSREQPHSADLSEVKCSCVYCSMLNAKSNYFQHITGSLCVNRTYSVNNTLQHNTRRLRSTKLISI